MGISSQKQTLVLLDAHAIIHRAYHALPEFSSSNGMPTGALYGLTTMLLKICSDLKPDYVVACYDLPQKTFRHEVYDGYKAGRAKTDDALVSQLESSRSIFEAFHIPIYDAPGFEADDMLGTIVEQLKDDPNIQIVIASGDMDTLQLVSGSKVKVFTLKKGLNDTILYDEESVIQRFGFEPKYLPDYKGLRGDPSDNIIGISGIGEKTATILIQKFKKIETLYTKLKKDKKMFVEIGISPRMQELLVNGEEDALFSKTLATIRRDAPVVFVLPEKHFRDALDFEKIEKLFRFFEFKSLIDRVRKILQPQVNSDDGKSKNIKNKIIENTVSSEISADEFQKLRIALWLLNSDLINQKESDILTYQNAESLAEAREKLLTGIKKENLTFVYESIELPLIPIIAKMESTGILIDQKYFRKLSDSYHTELTRLEKSIFAYVGHEFNINSPKQLGDILFDEMKLGTTDGKKLKKTRGGARSTRESELEKLRGVHPIIDDIFKYRELQKLLSTYIDTIPKLVKSDGRLHAGFNQTGATTGRFSSQNPNLQNIPIKTELGKNIRHGFIAPKGSVLMSFDYSQIELRIAAILSQDHYLIKVFQDDKDIHAAVAAKVFGVSENEVTPDMRRKAKVINFGILYGMGVNALRENLGGDRKEAQLFYDNYFAQFPTIRGYIDGVIAFARDHGYTETLFGRKRYFPGIKSRIPFIKAMAERMATNAPLQGTQADIIKMSMQEVEKVLIQKKILNHVRLLLQVHDELVYEVDEAYIEQARSIITNVMEHIIPQSFLHNRQPVPVRVGASIGADWGMLK